MSGPPGRELPGRGGNWIREGERKAVRTSGRRPLPPGGPPAGSRLPSPEEIAASLAKTFGFPKAEALERVRRALETLGPGRGHDLAAVVLAALRG